MAKPASKAKLLSEIKTRHKRLKEKIAGISPDIMLKPKTVGAWSVKDTIAHITAWERMFLTWYNDGLAGKKIDLPKETLGVINRRIFEKNLSRDLDDVLNDFAVTYRQILSTIESLSEEDIFTRGKFTWTGNKKLFAYIWANTAGHYAEHLTAIKRMKK